ncbi:hypothetical protein NOCA290032 [metagenome]|uniref:Uncharacterized protein n=1 Tax=metagenome TaxID=256318 RepID=A0A2P2CFW2_9ZZZZ
MPGDLGALRAHLRRTPGGAADRGRPRGRPAPARDRQRLRGRRLTVELRLPARRLAPPGPSSCASRRRNSMGREAQVVGPGGATRRGVLHRLVASPVHSGPFSVEERHSSVGNVPMPEILLKILDSYPLCGAPDRHTTVLRVPPGALIARRQRHIRRGNSSHQRGDTAGGVGVNGGSIGASPNRSN